MKKIVQYLAGVLAAAVFAPPASALPVFARQTGMACAACHFQHFPMLNSFGRAFKASGYTIIGSEAKVEGNGAGLSIPATLNMAVLTTAGYVKTNATTSGTAMNLKDPADGSVYVLGTNGELSLFIGGRVTENMGFLTELGFLGESGAAGLGSAKAPMLFEVTDGVRAGPVIFTTSGQGASYSYEALNTGANAVHTMLFIGGDANGSIGPTVSAQQYLGTNTPATGVALVMNSTMGFFNITKFHQVGPNDLGGNGGSLSSTYLRAAGTFDLGNWDVGAGVQSWSGRSIDADGVAGVLATSTPAPLLDTKATAIDFQMQGEAGAMPLGIYVTFARAPSTDIDNPGVGNVYNHGTETKSAFTISAEIGVVPEIATVGAGIRRGKSGVNANDALGVPLTGTNATDNAFLVEGSYKLAQNVMLNLYYTKQSGTYWDQANSDAIGSKQITLNLATLF